MPNAKGRFLGMLVPASAKWPPEREPQGGYVPPPDDASDEGATEWTTPPDVEWRDR